MKEIALGKSPSAQEGLRRHTGSVTSVARSIWLGWLPFQAALRKAPDPVIVQLAARSRRRWNVGGVLRSMESMKLEPLNKYARFAFALGRADGTAGLIAKILAQRFGPLPYEVKLRLSEALLWKLELIADRLLTAKTLDDAVR